MSTQIPTGAAFPPSPTPTQQNASYDAFLSYSHHDRAPARGVHKGLHAIGRRFGQLRALRVFRDATDLTASPDLWGKVTAAMDDSAYLVLVLSPFAASSTWVGRELSYWLDAKGPESLFLVVAAGTLAWDDHSGRFDPERSTAAPPLLTQAGVLPAQPFYVDISRDAPWDHKDPLFREKITDLAAPLHGKRKSDLAGDDLREQRRIRLFRNGAILALIVLTVTSVIAASIAVDRRNSAIEERYAATSRQLVAQSAAIEDERPSLARQLLLQGHRLSQTGESTGALIRSPRLSNELRVPGEPIVAANPVQPLLAVISDQELVLFDTDSLRALKTVTASAPDPGAAVFSSTGGGLAATTATDHVGLFDVANTAKIEQVGKISVPTSAVSRLAYARDRDILIIESTMSTLAFYDVSDPAKPVHLVTVPNTSTDEGGLRLLDDGTLLSQTRVTPSGVNVSSLPVPVIVTPISVDPRTVVTPDQQTLAMGASDISSDVQLWDIGRPSSPRLRASFPGESFGVTDIAISSDGQTLAVGAPSGVTQLWRLEDITRPILGDRISGLAAETDAVAFGSRDRQLVVVSADPVSELENGTPGSSLIRTWPLLGANRAASTSSIDGGRQAVPAWSPDGRSAIGGFPARLWDLGDPRYPRPGPPLPTLTIGGGAAYAFQPGAEVVASGLPIILWDMSDLSEPRKFNVESAVDWPASLMIFSPDGTFIASGDATISLWSVMGSSTRLLAELPETSASPHSADFTADGATLVALDGRGGANLWDIREPERPQVLARLSTSVGGMSALTTDKNSANLISGNRRGELTVWDISDVGHPRKLETRSAHAAPITGLALSPNGDMLATAGEDAVRLWRRDPHTGAATPVATLQAGGIYDGAALSFSPDGTLLAAATSDGMQIWDIDVERLLSQLCAESETISESQWREYLPADIPYDPPCRNPADTRTP